MLKKRHMVKSTVLLGIILLLLITFTGIISYSYYIEINVATSSCNTMNGIVSEQRSEFISKIENQKRTIKTYANLFTQDNLSQERVIKELSLIVENSNFASATLALLDGKAVKDNGEFLDLSDRDYFTQALEGKTVVEGPLLSKVTGENVVVFATPVRKEDRIISVLVVIYDAQTFSALFQSSFGGRGCTYAATGEGYIIARTDGPGFFPLYDNIFDNLENVVSRKYDSVPEMKANIAANQSGHIHYKINNEKRLMHYVPLGVNDWTIFCVANESVVTSNGANIIKGTTLFAVAIFVLCLVAILCFLLLHKKHMKELSEIAFVDNLTGVANRRMFKITASDLLATQSCKYAFVSMDIDKFKVLNDTLSYDCGDKLLICIANILKGIVKSDETFGRCDSDDYYMLLKYIDNADLKIRIETIFARVDERFKFEINRTYNLVLCVGVYVVNDSTEQINVVIDRAKHAQLLSKGHIVSSFSFYSEKIHERILQEKVIENRMQHALDNGEFMLFLQPKYQLTDETICGAEALVRWSTGDATILYPDQFIPVFEKNGFITQLDMQMLELSCAFIKTWIDAGVKPIPISINFSRLHLQNPHFVDDIGKIVDKYGIPSELIEVELTESTILNNERDLINVLAQLHEHGFTLSMDDFGSGYSSLGLLKNLPVDVVKLDRTFFTQYNDLERAKTVISNMILMAKELGIDTVAEGVETKEHIDLLQELGCDIVQGYYFARPMPAKDLNKLMKNL